MSGFSKHGRICRVCGRKRLLCLATLMCAGCSGDDVKTYTQDESPAVLRGRWVPNGKGTMRYEEAS